MGERDVRATNGLSDSADPGPGLFAEFAALLSQALAGIDGQSTYQSDIARVNQEKTSDITK
jgi:hypothetical protein